MCSCSFGCLRQMQPTNPFTSCSLSNLANFPPPSNFHPKINPIHNLMLMLKSFSSCCVEAEFRLFISFSKVKSSCCQHQEEIVERIEFSTTGIERGGLQTAFQLGRAGTSVTSATFTFRRKIGHQNIWSQKILVAKKNYNFFLFFSTAKRCS